MAAPFGTCEWASTMGPAYSATAGEALASSAARTIARIMSDGLSSGVPRALRIPLEVLAERLEQSSQGFLLGRRGDGDRVLHRAGHPLARLLAIDLDLELHGSASGRLVSHFAPSRA